MSNEDMDLFLGASVRAGTKKAWTPQQEAVFEAVVKGQGNLEVVARAGAGKSTTILECAVRLPPKVNAGLTAFNRTIADDLKAKAPDSLKVRTFHAAGFAILKAHDRHCTIDTDKGILLAKEAAGMGAPTKLVTAVKRAASMCKAYLVEDLERAQEVFEDHDIDADGLVSQRELAQMAFAAMKSAKEMPGLVDFDDQVWLPIVLNLKPKYVNDIVFVDEAQDMAENQLRLAFSLAGGVGRIVVVYDPFQAIYEWRGAGTAMFNRIRSQLQAKQMPLTVTFRCARSIVRKANELVPDLEAAPNAEEGLVENLAVNQLITKARPGDVIISRTNAALIKQCMAFIRAGIKSNIVGRDLGKTLSGMVTRSQASSVTDLLDWVAAWRMREVDKCQAKDQDPQPITDKAACVEAFADGAKSIAEVLRNISVMFDDGDDRERVLFSSTHRFKGMERDRVFLLWSTYLNARTVRNETGEYVTQAVTFEERALAYVAITRAKKELYLVR